MQSSAAEENPTSYDIYDSEYMRKSEGEEGEGEFEDGGSLQEEPASRLGFDRTQRQTAEAVQQNIAALSAPWDEKLDRNPTIVKGRRYVMTEREDEDPLSPGPKFGVWGESPRRGRGGGGGDWVPSSRSKSPQKRFGSPDRYSYLPSSARGQQEVEFHPYAEGAVPDADMLPLFKLLDPGTLAGCPRKAAHARAEAFRALREERSGRLEALKIVNTQDAELKELREIAKRARSVKAKLEHSVKVSRETVVERCGAAETTISVLKSKLASLEAHLVSVQSQLQGQREINSKLTTALNAERIVSAKVPNLESHISSLKQELEGQREMNARTSSKLAAEERLCASKTAGMEQHMASLKDELDALREMNGRLTSGAIAVATHAMHTAHTSQAPMMSPMAYTARPLPVPSFPGGDEQTLILQRLRMEMMNLMNAKECAERLVVAERVARQATEAALRDADVRERDISTVKRRLEAELAALRGETVDAKKPASNWRRSLRHSSRDDGRRSVGSGDEKDVDPEEETEEEEEKRGNPSREEEEEEALSNGGSRSGGEEEEEDEETASRTSEDREQEHENALRLEIAEKNVGDLSDLVTKLRALVAEKDSQLETLAIALKRSHKDAKKALKQAEEHWMAEGGQLFEARYIRAHEVALREETLLRRRLEREFQRAEKVLKQEVRDLQKRCGMLQQKLNSYEYAAGGGAVPFSPPRSRSVSRSQSPGRRTRGASPSKYIMESRANAHVLRACLPEMMGQHGACMAESMFK